MGYLFEFLINSEKTQIVINIISILGFITSSFLVVNKFIANRKNITIKIHDYTSYTEIKQFFLTIQNNSNLPICIHSFTLEYSEKTFYCELIPKKIRGDSDSLIKSPMFPINLAPKQGFQCFLEFLNCEGIELAQGKTIVFQIQTNRGQLKRELILGPISYYLHTKEQWRESLH